MRRNAKPKKTYDNLYETVRAWCLEQVEFSWEQAAAQLRTYEYNPRFQRRELYTLLMALVDSGELRIVVDWDGHGNKPVVIFARSEV